MMEHDARAALRDRLSAARAAHSERVAETGAALARRHGLDQGAALLAGLLHDWCRELPAAETLALGRELGLVADAADPQLVVGALHGPIAARVLPRRWPELPAAVLQAIDRHTTGDPAMTELDAVLFVADITEPGRAWDGVAALRALADGDLWAATRLALTTTLRDLLERGRRIDPRAVLARNALLARVAQAHAGTAPG